MWEYHVSHGSLLLRSPEGVGHRATVDIICTGVSYVAVPRHMGEIEVAGATVEEVAGVEKILGKRSGCRSKCTCWRVRGDAFRWWR